MNLNAMEKHAMRYRLCLIAALAAMVVFAVGACNLMGGGKAAQDAAKATKDAQDKVSDIRMPKPAPAPPAPGEKKPDVKVETAAPENSEEAVTASYDPINKPDPFRPFKPEAALGAAKESDNPLLKYEIRYFKLVGIIRDVDNPAAIFEDPAGRAYTLHQGQPIGKNGGVIRAILDDAVVITETRISWRSEGTETVEMTIRLRPDEKKT